MCSSAMGNLEWELRVKTSVSELVESCGDGVKNGMQTGFEIAATSHLTVVFPLQLVLWLL